MAGGQGDGEPVGLVFVGVECELDAGGPCATELRQRVKGVARERG